MTSSAPTVREIVFEVFLRAAPETVWNALVDPTELSRWSYMERATLDCLEVGGRYRFVDPPGPEDGAEILELDAPRRLVYRWRSSEPEPTIMTYELAPSGSSTRLRVCNGPYPAGSKWDDFYGRNFAGWVDLHLKLRELVEADATSRV